jgi:hypothetical protein
MCSDAAANKRLGAPVAALQTPTAAVEQKDKTRQFTDLTTKNQYSKLDPQTL